MTIFKNTKNEILHFRTDLFNKQVFTHIQKLSLKVFLILSFSFCFKSRINFSNMSYILWINIAKSTLNCLWTLFSFHYYRVQLPAFALLWPWVQCSFFCFVFVHLSNECKMRCLRRWLYLHGYVVSITVVFSCHSVSFPIFLDRLQVPEHRVFVLLWKFFSDAIYHNLRSLSVYYISVYLFYFHH